MTRRELAIRATASVAAVKVAVGGVSPLILIGWGAVLLRPAV